MIESQIRDALHQADAGARPEFGAELEARLADQYDGVEGVAELVDMTSRRPRRWAIATIGIAAALAVVLGVGLLARTGNDGSVTATTTVTVTPKQQAQALAEKLLDGLTLPPGSVDAAAPAIDIFPTEQSTTLRVAKAWSVPRSVADTDVFLRAHVAPGMSVTGTGTIGDGRLLNEDLAPLPDGFARVAIDIVTSTRGDNTHLTAQAVVTWFPPRGANEHIPARDKVVTVTFGSKGSKVFTDSETVSRLIAQFESSHTGLDGLHSCPSMSTRSGRYTLKFAATRSARPDVVVTIIDGGCRGAQVQVGSHDAAALDGYPLLEVVRPFFH
jgi:hypothetical protein